VFKKILLPADLAERHERALDVAADLAAGGEVVLLHVVETIAGLSMDEESTFYARLEKKARANLSRLGAILQERSVSWRAEVLCGSRLREIIRFAAAESIDLIVLTSPRLDPNDLGTGWGSLSYKISLMCQCPVLLVK
jgi:universal stress protein A